MKRKKLLWLLLAAAAILCIVIFRQPVYRDPPELMVIPDSGTTGPKVEGTATSWRYKNLWSWIGYESGQKPLTVLDPDTLYPIHSDSGKILLKFEVEPDQLTLTWRDPAAEQYENAVEVGQTLVVDQLKLAPGTCLYEITAKWESEGRRWGGTAIYRFLGIGPEKPALGTPEEGESAAALPQEEYGAVRPITIEVEVVKTPDEIGLSLFHAISRKTGVEKWIPICEHTEIFWANGDPASASDIAIGQIIEATVNNQVLMDPFDPPIEKHDDCYKLVIFE